LVRILKDFTANHGSGDLTVGNNGHIPNVLRVVHESTDLRQCEPLSLPPLKPKPQLHLYPSQPAGVYSGTSVAYLVDCEAVEKKIVSITTH